MSKQTITPEQWLAAVAAVDDNPAVRAMARQTLEEYRRRGDIERRAREFLADPRMYGSWNTIQAILGERTQP